MILSVIPLTKGLKEIIIIINIKRWVMKLLLKATFVSNECLFLWCMLIILSHSKLGRSIEYESRWVSRLQLENEWVVCRVRRRWLKWMLLKKSLYKFLGRKRLFLLLFFSLSSHSTFFSLFWKNTNVSGESVFSLSRLKRRVKVLDTHNFFHVFKNRRERLFQVKSNQEK